MKIVRSWSYQQIMEGIQHSGILYEEKEGYFGQKEEEAVRCDEERT